MRNKKPCLVVSFLLFIVLVGCQQTPDTHYQAALLVKPSAQSLQTIKQAVKQLANLPSVVLAHNVLQKDSWLFIDRQGHKDAQGQLLMGNNTLPPTALQLVTDQQQCFLAYPKVNKILLLDGVSCQLVVN